MENEVREVTIRPDRDSEVSEESLRKINMPDAQVAPEEMFEHLLQVLSDKRPTDSADIIVKAYDVARGAHGEQFRKSGEPYIIHPLAVKKILEDWGMDEDTIIAGILHDTVEDTNLTLWQFDDIIRTVLKHDLRVNHHIVALHLTHRLIDRMPRA